LEKLNLFFFQQIKRYRKFFCSFGNGINLLDLTDFLKSINLMKINTIQDLEKKIKGLKFKDKDLT
jgi:hypothetical protein